MMPTTLQEAIDELIKINIPPDEINSRWIRNEWGLWTGSLLAFWFFEKEIYHADDMSGIIVDSYRRTIGGQPIDLESQIEVYHKHWEEIYGKSYKQKMLDDLSEEIKLVLKRDSKITTLL